MKCYKNIIVIICFFVFAAIVGKAWGQSCGGEYTTYSYLTTDYGANNNYGPIPTNTYRSYRQYIYNKGSMCRGKIKRIAFWYKGSNNMTQKNNVSIYMVETNKSSFSSTTDWIALSNFTLVYSGSLNCAASSGWNYFTLSGDGFDYSGEKNLAIAILDNSNRMEGNSGYTFQYVMASQQVGLIYNSTSQDDLTPGTTTYTASLTSYRPSTAFCIKCAPACTDPGTFAFSDDSEIILLGNTIDITDGGNLTIPGISGTVSYESSDDDVATVDGSGVVTAIAEGSATITATFTPSDASYCTKSDTYTITVTDGCTQVGSGTSHGHNVPIYIATGSTARYSYSQQLYLAADIASDAGTIQHLKFQYYGNTNLELPIEIYLGQTTATSLASGWITDASLTQVYTGTPTFSQGWVDIDIDGYYWNGSSNILVAVKTTQSTINGPSSANDFYYTTVTGCARYTNPTSVAVLDANMCPSQGGSSTDNRPNIRFCITPCTPIVGTFSLSSTSSSKTIGETVNLASGAGILTNSVTTPGTLSYSSNLPSVASVTSTGLVTALQAGTAEITVTYTPTSSAYCTTNLVYTITVTDGCSQVGSGATKGHITPFYSTNSNYYSYTQQLYTASEITAAGGEEGLVESIKFNYYGEAANENLPIEVYLGLTEQTTLADGLGGWISDANLVQVYSGNKTFASGWVDIDVSAAGFRWDGESNILVAMRTTSKPTEGDFYYTNVVGGAKYASSNTSAIAINATTYIPTSAAGNVTDNRPQIKFCIDACTDRASTLAFSTDTIRIVSGDSFARPTLSGSATPSGTITYTSSNPAVATITNSSTGALSMTGRYGTAVITASTPYETIGSVDYCAARAKYVIVVSCREPIASIDTTSLTLAPSETYNHLSIVSNNAGGVTWNSSNNSVATVDGNGLVTAVAEGYCVITGTVAADGIYCETTVTCNVHVAADDCTRVGWGTSTAPSLGAYSNIYRYSYTQQLYSATEIRMAGGRAGTINSIKVKYKGSYDVVSEIYMGMTTKDNLEDDYVRSGLTLVRSSGTINFVDGWTEITLDNPFQWDGESNIVVVFNNDRGTTNTDSQNGCLVHVAQWNSNNITEHAYKLRYYQVDNPSIVLNTSHLPTTYSGISDNRSDMKFCITECNNPVDVYFSSDNIIVALSGGTVATSLTVSPGSGHGTVTYSSDNESVATVNSTTGEITPVAEGSATIIASVAANGEYCAATAYLNVTVCNCPVAGDEQYQMGNQANSEYTCAPVDNTDNYGYRQIIYPSDMLTPGTIHSIAFNYVHTNNLTLKDNVVIYMGHTNKDEFESKTDWITSGLTQVYSGALTCTQGWNKFNLHTTFVYNGCDNLVVAIDDNSGHYNGDISSSDRRDYYKFYTSTSSNNVMIYYHDNTTNVVPATPPTALLVTNNYPDVKFCITPSVSVAEHVHTLSYDVTTNCTGDGATVTPTSVSGETASYANVTTIMPSCSTFVGFKEWNTAADGSGTSYHAGDRVNLSCNDVTLYAIYNNEVQGESSCENAVAFCNGNSLSFAVSEGYGENYGNFCAFFNSPGTWWHMQIDEPGDIYMTVASTAGDVDMACWGPFNNKTCDLSDLTDNGANGWYTYSHANEHYTNTDATPTLLTSTPVCSTNTLARPSGNLVDYGGSNSAEEYLQIVNAQHGDYYMILVANYANRDGYITFTQTGGEGRASCDVVTNCDITSISANTECMNSYSYKVSGEVSFRDAPTDGTLTVALGSNTLTFTPPFASPIAYEFTGLTPNGASMNITATFESSTVNCSKTSSYVAPTKDYCKEVFLPITLVRLRGECNGKRALISWTTASEHNNDYFVVERSDDAVNFVEIGRVAGAGNSIEMLSYNYADYSIRTGENYYRLTQVDYDGTRTTSEIIEVHCSGNVPLGDPDVYVYPNPFGDELTVHLVNFGDVAAHIQVYDMLGRMLFERTADDTEVVLQLGALSDAAYTVRVSTADFVVNKKVVKNN